MNYKSTTLLFCLVWALIMSCTSTLPPIESYPDLDKDLKFMHFSGEGYETGMMHVTDLYGKQLKTVGYSNSRAVTFWNHIRIKHIGPDFTPFVKPHSSGEYMLLIDDEIKYDFRTQPKVVLWNMVRNEELPEIRIDRYPFKNLYDTYMLQWSELDDAFYCIQSDTVRKYMSDGRCINVLAAKKMKYISVAPDEKNILVQKEKSITMVNFNQGNKSHVLNADDPIRIIAWSPFEPKVAFVIGWKIYIYDLEKEVISQHKIKADMYNINWLNREALVVVTGKYPSPGSMLQTEQRFKIRTLNLQSGNEKVIYTRLGHGPFSIRPQVSRSGLLILFSIFDDNEGYQIKMIKSDGSAISTICSGTHPQWYYGK